MARINISIPDYLLSEIDNYKKIKKVNRSQFLIDAAKKYFSEIDDEISQEKRIKAFKSLLKTRKEIQKYFYGKKIDVVGEIKKMREERMQILEDILAENKNGTK
ncbi:MAG: hypothetical protein FJW66_02945 [Actinobacteria bacterium]|nr:hypothetical protein [Actinomycetota bacterium]